MKLLLEEPHRRIDVLKTVFVRCAVALLFVFIGYSKFGARSEWIGIFDRIGLGQWFRYFTGIVQIAGGVLVLIRPAFAIGILMLSCTMIGAVAVDILIGLPHFAIIPLAILLGLLFIGGEELIDLASRFRNRNH